MRNWIRRLIGLALMLIAAGGLVYWEMEGRDRFLTEEVLVAVRDINANECITPAMFVAEGVHDETIIASALRPADRDLLAGTRSRQFIPARAQIAEAFFYKDPFMLAEGESVFVIKPDWITMISSSIRQGDHVRLYSRDGSIDLGKYQVAFVKDSAFREVRTVTADMANTGSSQPAAGGSSGSGMPSDGPAMRDDADILDRTDAASVAEHIEIIATLEAYKRILDHAETQGGILIVQQRSRSEALR